MGIKDELKITKVSGLLVKEDRNWLINLIKRYIDCFSWDNCKVLSRELVEHQLSIKEGFKPYKQTQRKFNPELYLRIKQEIERLLKVGFI